MVLILRRIGGETDYPGRCPPSVFRAKKTEAQRGDGVPELTQ